MTGLPRRGFDSRLLPLLLLPLFFVGCGHDHGTNPGPSKIDPLEYPVATTESQLIKNFETAYNDRDYEQYDHLLDEDFQFWFAPQDIDTIGQGPFWDRQQDARATYNMFNGATGKRPDGSTIPAVQSIQLTLNPEEVWKDAGGEVIAGQTTLPDGAKKASWSVSMKIYYTDDSVVSSLLAREMFYAVSVPTSQEGVEEWKLILWRDLGSRFKSDQSASWGWIKALFGDRDSGAK